MQPTARTDQQLIEANRAFYDSLWSGASLVEAQHFNTWPLVRPLVERDPHEVVGGGQANAELGRDGPKGQARHPEAQRLFAPFLLGDALPASVRFVSETHPADAFAFNPAPGSLGGLASYYIPVIPAGGVRTFTIIGWLQCVGAGGFVALMVVWIDQRLGIGTEGLRFGLVFGAWSVGGLAASLALPFLVRRYAAARIALTALPFAAAVGLVVPFVTTWWVAGLVLILSVNLQRSRAGRAWMAIRDREIAAESVGIDVARFR